MGVRALVIAIENYPSLAAGGIARTLPGTLQAGLDFKHWLEHKWAAENRPPGETQMLFCSEPVHPAGLGATRKDLLRALLQLKQNGQNATDELYVFFSGHGFSFVERPGSRVDVVLAADFETPELSSDCCLNLDEIVAWLRDHLGPGRHYYFVDACRNPIDVSQIQVGALLPIDPHVSTEPSTFVLQSTIEGATAAADNRFAATLMAGLRGKGKAKTWDTAVPDAMVVRYDSLRRFVKTALAEVQPISSRVEGPEGESDAVLATLRPVPLSKCTIRVDDVLPHDRGEISLKRARSSADERKPIGSEPLVLEVEPDIYSIAVRLQDATVIPDTAVAVDLFDDQAMVFTRVHSLRGVTALPARPLPSLAAMNAATFVRARVVVPPGASVSLRNVQNGAVREFDASTPVSLPAGLYVGTLSMSWERIIDQQEIELALGTDAVIDWPNWRTKRDVSFWLISGEISPEAIEELRDFSPDWMVRAASRRRIGDDVWLAIAGGWPLVGGRTSRWGELLGLPVLHEFRRELPGASPIYVLAGLEDPALSLRIGTSRDAQVTWRDATEPPGMRGVKELHLRAAPGWTLVSFAIGTRPAYTVASYAAPNRGTLITLTDDGEGLPCVSQYLLPIRHLMPYLPGHEDVPIDDLRKLADVHSLARASRAFRKRRDVAKEIGSSQLDDLLRAKWLDPIASSLAGYELVRRGRRDDLGEVVRNMKTHFPDLPDTAALGKLAGEPVPGPVGVPLFFDGLRAFPDFTRWLPLPATHLDYSSSWTAWRGAVR